MPTCNDCPCQGPAGLDVVMSPIFKLWLCIKCWLGRWKDKPTGKH